MNDMTVSDINRLHKEAISHAQSAVEKALECGKLLCEYKAKTEYGKWEDWCQTNLEFTDRQARSYMQAFAFIEIERKSASVLEHYSSLREILDAAKKKRNEERLAKEETERKARYDADAPARESREAEKERERKKKERDWEKRNEQCRREEIERNRNGYSSTDDIFKQLGIFPLARETWDIIIKTLIQRNHPDKGGDATYLRKLISMKEYMDACFDRRKNEPMR